MKYFFDTEFIEAPGHLDLISIGIVSETGERFYAESSEVDWSRASQWVLDNVKPHLTGASVTRDEIAAGVIAFVGEDASPEFWAYYADYDWVAFCWLFGTMMDLPKGFPFYCRDIKQWMDQLGVAREDLPPDPQAAHNALADALWNAEVYRLLALQSALNKAA